MSVTISSGREAVVVVDAGAAALILLCGPPSLRADGGGVDLVLLLLRCPLMADGQYVAVGDG